jgi:hypothetical protein
MSMQRTAPVIKNGICQYKNSIAILLNKLENELENDNYGETTVNYGENCLKQK